MNMALCMAYIISTTALGLNYKKDPDIPKLRERVLSEEGTVFHSKEKASLM